MKKKTDKKRGGQTGNKNALKHGFYSELLTKEEIARLNKIKDVDLDDETSLLRALVYRFAQNIDTGDMDEARKTANTIANMIQGINTTQRTKLLAKGAGGEIAETIMQALLSLNPYKEL